MRVIVPFEVTDSVLDSSTVPETDYAAWAAGTTYAAGDKVIRTTTHRIYEALVSTTGDTPETSPLKWLDLGATNRWCMFDQKVGTATTATTSMTVEFTASQIVQAVALLELDAREVTVIVTDAVEGEVYSKTVGLQSPPSEPTWWSYFFEPYVKRTTATFEDLPSFSGATISVTISGETEETVSCGVCIIGQVYQFAEAVRFGAEVGIQDYSRKEADDWGNLQVVERAWTKRTSWEFMVDSGSVDLLQRTLANLRATPSVYIGGDNYDALSVYGFFKDFNIIISYPKWADCSLELEGLI